MQLTPIRVVFFALPSLLAMAACGQVTGLSNDYQFDLVDDGGSSATGDASGDATASDASSSTDARVDAADAAPKCSTAQTTLANTRLSQFSGTPACKSCLATSCCTDIEPCTSASECKRVLSCRLDCTTKAADQRPDCYSNCSNGNAPPALYTQGVGACSTASCKTQCGFPQ
jgi:hypothetical protein